MHPLTFFHKQVGGYISFLDPSHLLRSFSFFKKMYNFSLDPSHFQNWTFPSQSLLIFKIIYISISYILLIFQKCTLHPSCTLQKRESQTNTSDQGKNASLRRDFYMQNPHWTVQYINSNFHHKLSSFKTVEEINTQIMIL